MWICLNNAFLSIVQPKPIERAPAGTLLVRARRAEDIERTFPGYAAITLTGRDYQFRALIPREVVGKTIAEALTSITYTNFKDSVRDGKLRHAYGDFWQTMADLQPQRPYSNYRNASPRPPIQRGPAFALSASSGTSSHASVPAPVKPIDAVRNLAEKVRSVCLERRADHRTEPSLALPIGAVRVLGTMMGDGTARVSYQLNGARINRLALEAKLNASA